MDARTIGSVHDALLLQRMPPRDGEPPGRGDDFGVRAAPPAWFTTAPRSSSGPSGPSGPSEPPCTPPAPTTYVETYVMTVVEAEAAAAADLFHFEKVVAATSGAAVDPVDPVDPEDPKDFDDPHDHDPDDPRITRTIHLLPLMHELASRRHRHLASGASTEVRVEDLMQCHRRPRTPGGLFAALRALNGRPPRLVAPRQLALAAQRERAVASLPEGWGCCEVTEDDCAQHLAWLLLRSVGVPKDVLPKQAARQAFVPVKAAFQAVAKQLGWNQAAGCC